MSNKRKLVHVCGEPGCRAAAAVQMSTVDDDGTERGRAVWLCRAHAVERARRFGGRLWGDAACSCGCVDGIIEAAGRTKHGDL